MPSFTTSAFCLSTAARRAPVIQKPSAVTVCLGLTGSVSAPFRLTKGAPASVVRQISCRVQVV